MMRCRNIRSLYVVTRCLVLLVLPLSSASVLAQNCNNTDVVLPDSSRFDINDDGTVTDIESGLTWQRCLIGQQWDGKTCVGDADLYTWQQAASVLQNSTNVTNRRLSGEARRWRLPKIFELAAIVDLRCNSPRIDLAVFPGTAARPHWTINNVPDNWGLAYTLSFGNEGVARAHKSDKHYVRLVSGRE